MKEKGLKKIKKYVVIAVTIVVALGIYAYLYDNWDRDFICNAGGIFRWVTLAYGGLLLLLLARIHREKPVVYIANNYMQALLILFVPGLAIFIEESVWNIYLDQITFRSLLITYIYVLLLTICLLLLCRKAWIVYEVILLVGFVYGLLNYFVLLVRGYPIRFGDLLAINTAVSVMDNYDFTINDQVLRILFLYLIAAILLLDFSPVGIKKKYKLTDWVGTIGISVLAGTIMLSFNLQDITGISLDGWNPEDAFYAHGAPMSFLVSAQNQHGKKPKGYTEKKAKELLADVQTSVKENSEKPSVILIMNESFADMSVVGPEGVEDYLINWNAVDDYVVKGYTYVSTLGGGTCNSEFEVLTGCSIANIPSGIYPYQSYSLKNSFSLPKVFAEEGYETIAFHPYIPNNWNRVRVYEELGFDKFLSEDDVEDMKLASWCCSDESDFQKIIQIYEERTGPLFLFNVTMQNHGGYDKELRSDIVPLQMEERYNHYQDAINYYTLINETDKAYKLLIDYFSNQKEPVIICMFGDHQPALDDNYLHEIEQDKVSDMERYQSRYITPYMVWSNYDLGYQSDEQNLSLNYLGAYISSIAGLNSEYGNYLNKLRTEIPITNSIGYMTEDGSWHYQSESNQYLDDYKFVQYYELFERK